MSFGTKSPVFRLEDAGVESTIIRRIHLIGLLLAVLGVASIAASVRAAAAEPPKKIVAVLQPFLENHTLGGAVTLVASSNKVVSVEAAGYMDIATKKPMRTDSLFWIASQSKPLTATALMMLVDEGKVNVDDPVEKYLPEFKDQWLTVEEDKEKMLLRKPQRPITVKNVLTHTSGMPFQSPLEQPTLDVLPLAVRVQSYAMLALQFEPGSKYKYSNAGVNIAGRIIEVVSGMPYERFMEQRLFSPLGMKDTTFWPSERQVRRLAKSYKLNADKTGLKETTITQLHYPLTDRTRQPMPAGGLFSTAADVARFCQMILNGGVFDGKRYLSEAAVKQMTSKQTGDTVKEEYGFCWDTDKGYTGNGGWVGHGGAYSTDMRINSKRGLILIFMAQQTDFPGDWDKTQDAFKQAAEAAFAK